jgi:hypothetical protein
MPSGAISMKWTKQSAWVVLISVLAIAMHALGLFGARFLFSVQRQDAAGKAEREYTGPDGRVYTDNGFPVTMPALAAATLVFVMLGVDYIDRWRQKRRGRVDMCASTWRRAVLFGVLFGAMLAVSALSIAVQEISTKEMVEALQPMLIAMISVVYEGRAIRAWEIAAICVTTGGVALTVVETVHLELLGVVYSLLIVGTSSLMTCVIGKGEKDPDAVGFMLSASVYAAFVTLPCALAVEGRAWVAFCYARPLVALGRAAIAGLTIVIYQYIHVKFIRMTSSRYVGMVYSLKTTLMIVLSILVYESPEDTSLLRWTGIGVSIAGFCVYQWKSGSGTGRGDEGKGKGDDGKGK